MPKDPFTTKVWKELTWQQYVSVAVYLVSALIPIIMYAIFGGGTQTYIAVVAGTSVIITFDRISRFYFENITEKKLNRMIHKLDAGSLQCIGGIGRGLDWLSDNLDGAQRVLNMVFSRSDLEFSAGISDKIQNFEKAARTALDRGCIWTDMYVVSETNVINRFFSSLNANQAENYKTLRLGSDIPMFQYTLLFYKNLDAAVIFGWSFTGGSGQNARVFVSDDPATVNFFADHFRSLRVHCSPEPEPPRGDQRHAGNPEPLRLG